MFSMAIAMAEALERAEKSSKAEFQGAKKPILKCLLEPGKCSLKKISPFSSQDEAFVVRVENGWLVRRGFVLGGALLRLLEGLWKDEGEGKED